MAAAALLALGHALPAGAQAPLRKIVEMEVSILGVTAGVDPANPVVPKNTEAGVRVVVRAGASELPLAEVARFFGAGFTVEGELSGPGLAETLTLVTPPDAADPLILPFPALPTAGDYTLSNVRLVSSGRIALEVQPRQIPVEVIEQVLVTSVKTRPLTLDEIRAKGIVLDSDDYYAFEFSLGLKLDSKAVDITFPVAFSREGVPVPQFISPPPAPTRQADVPQVRLPTIVPVLFEVEDSEDGGGGEGQRLPPLPTGGGEVRIPSVIIIPGNVGYLKQFFSAKLFVANGAPAGSGLSVRDITGTLKLPLGPDLVKGPNPQTGKNDDPLALPTLLRDGKEVFQPETMRVRAVGPDGLPETADDVETIAPGEQAEGEFLIRGESEGFHTIDFDIRAELLGLVTGPVRIKGKAAGAVLVRNPFFDVTFTVPGVVRTGETFKVFVTLTNLGQGAANNVVIDIPEGVTSGAKIVGGLPPPIPTIAPGTSQVFELSFLAQRTGQVVASYLRFDPQDGQQRPTGSLQLSVGVGERGVPLSPDTLVLPTAVDGLPSGVVEAAMRVLGQAWSIANAPSGTLPRDVIRTNRNMVVQKALALAEAGLRVSLGQERADALRDVAFDFWGGEPLDPGFDQLLRTTDAGHGLARAIGAALVAEDVLDPFAFEAETAEVAASGPDFATFAVTGGSAESPLRITLLDGAGRRTSNLSPGGGLPAPAEVPGALLLPLGDEPGDPVVGVLAAANSGPYTLELRTTGQTMADVSLTLPRGDGTFTRGEFRGVLFEPGTIVRTSLDPISPGQIVLETEGVSATRDGQAIVSEGPRLVSATLIGPETLDGASPFGFQLVAVFDRVVDAQSAARTDNYEVPKNGAQAAGRKLSGRLVFVSLEQPEGPYVPTTFSVLGGVTDPRGTEGPPGTVDVASRLEDPGAIVTGRVFQADGTPAPAAIVTYINNPDLSCKLPRESGFAALPADADGQYEFRYVRRDACGWGFRVATQDPATGGRRHVSAHVRGGGEVITLDIALFGRGAVTGTVRDGQDEAVPGAQVVAYSLTDPQIGGSATTDAGGVYLVDGITVGPVAVKAGKGAFLGAAAGNIDRAGATAVVDVTIDDGNVRIEGTVFKVEGGVGTTVPGLSVYYHTPLPAFPFWKPLAVAVTGAEGRYVLEGVPAGRFKVTAALNQRDQDSREDEAPFGATVTDADLVIVVPAPQSPELATVSGQVYMPDGTLAEDVVVSIGNRGVLSPDGSFTIPGVKVQSGTQLVVAKTRDGRRSGSTTVVANLPNHYEGVVVFLSGIGNAAFRVIDETGQPVKGQKVALLGGCADPCGCKRADTDDDGIALFTDLSYGKFTARAIRSTATFTDVAQGIVSVSSGDTTFMTTIAFAGAGEVAGVARDHLGNPVHGAEVEINGNRFVYDGVQACDIRYGLVARARTGTDGKFRFGGINLGSVNVSATQDFLGKAGRKGKLETPGQVLTLDLTFENVTAGELSGHVLLPGGQDAGAGVEVTVEGPLPDVTVTTDPQGDYRFAEILPEGYYTLTARDVAGGGVFKGSVALKRQEDQTFDFRLKGRGNVRVQVVSGEGEDEEPLESALVRLEETAYPSRRFDQNVRPGTQGLVTFLDVYEGPVEAEASDPFGRSGSAKATLPGPGQEIDVKIRVTKTGRLTGRFLMPDRTTPIPWGTVTLSAGGRVIGQATTAGPGDDPGRFAFDYVPLGPVSLSAQDPLTARKGSASGELESELEPFELDVVAQGLGTVRGTVTRGGVAQGLAPVKVSGPGGYKASVVATGGGTYLVTGVPEGRITVTASLTSSGFLAGSASDVLEGDGTEVTIDVALREAGSVTGKVIPADPADLEAGRFPPADVRLYVGGTGGGEQTAATRPDGTFSFGLVPVGTASLTADVVDSIDRGSASLEVVAGDGNQVEIPLRGVGRLKGVAVESAEPEAPGVDGWITFSGPAFLQSTSVRLGNDGRFELPEVLAGDFTAKVRNGQGTLARYGSASATVRPGEETAIVVVLEPSGTIEGIVYRPADTPEGKRPAFGAEVRILHPKGEIPLLAQQDGTFSIRGVPLGAFSVRVFDPVSNGRAFQTDHQLASGGQVVHLEITIDDAAPVVSFSAPGEGSTSAALGGFLAIDVAPESAGDLDPAAARVIYPGKGSRSLTFDQAGLRFVGTLEDSWLVVGTNTLVATIPDESGNAGRAEVRWTVTGGRVHGVVTGGDGGLKEGATVKLGSKLTTSGPGGIYEFTGLRPGRYSAVATDPDTGLSSPTRSGDLADGGSLQLDLVLPAFGRLNGVVLRKGGAPAEGVTVTGAGRSAVSDAQGAFDLGTVATGSHALQASAPDGDQGAGSATVPSGGDANATFNLNGVGEVQVTVRTAGGAPVPDATVTVASSAPFPRSHKGKKTDAAGRVLYDRVLAGSITADASASGLGGSAGGFLDDGQRLELVVTLQPAGRITGVVHRAEGGVAGDVPVTLSGPKAATDRTDPGTGAFVFENVPFGHFTLKVTTAEGDFGEATGDLTVASPEADVPIALNGLGTVEVSVTDASGSVVPGAEVTVVALGRSFAKDADGDGLAAFTNVPAAAAVQATAVHPATGAVGDASGGPLTPGGTLPLAVGLEALGAVHVRVEDADGVAVEGAAVSLVVLGKTRTGQTGPDGLATFPDVRAAASLRATATDPVNGAKGEKTDGPLAAGGTLTITVALERLGTVGGRVLDADGATPVAGVLVEASGRSDLTDEQGRYELPDLQLKSHTLTAKVGGRLRARATVVLGGAALEQDLVLVGVGTVKGTITRSTGAAAGGAAVTLTSKTPQFGGAFTAAAGEDGGYEIGSVPVGPFTIKAELGADSRQVDDVVSFHGEEVILDLALLDSAATMPRTLTDGNDVDWEVQAAGGLESGHVFHNNEGTPRLTVVRDGTSVTFTGPACGSGVKCASTEEGGREVVVTQADLAGLEATRKVFVPADGYFARQLDLLRNPGPDPVIVSVVREAKLGPTVVVGTSSGDATVGVEDGWLVLDDAEDLDLYRPGANPATQPAPTAVVLGGPGGLAPTSLGATLVSGRMLVTQGWDGLTLAPGQTVAFLSLFSVQADRGRGLASAERLGQLPPEALVGLGPEEAAAVVNFVVPAGPSALPALPPNDGIVNGRVLAGDGETGWYDGNFGTVEFRSRSPHYGRPLRLTPLSSASFAYQFRGQATGTGTPTIVPRFDFDLTATLDPSRNPFEVPPLRQPGSFADGGVMDLTNVSGRVLRASSFWSSGFTPEKAVDDDPASYWSPAAGDAANLGKSPFLEIGLPGDATIHLVRVVGSPQASRRVFAARIDLYDAAGTVVHSQAVATSEIDGRYSGDFPVEPPVAGVRAVRWTNTVDASNAAGLAELRVFGEAALGPARDARQDLVFSDTGLVRARAVRSDSSVVVGAKVTLTDGVRSTGSSTVNAQGEFLWRIVPPGSYTTLADYPPSGAQASAVLTVEPARVNDVEVVFTGLGSISGLVRTAMGQAIGGAVTLSRPGFPNRTTSASATTGAFTFGDVVPDTYTVAVEDNRTGFTVERELAVAAGAPTLITVQLLPVARVTVQATWGSPGGPPVETALASVQEPPGGTERPIGAVTNGSVSDDVSGPEFKVIVRSTTSTGHPLQSVGEATASLSEGVPVTVPVVVPGLGTVGGRLLARDGRELTVGTVAAHDPLDPSKRVVGPVAAGRFALTTIPVGTHLLRNSFNEGSGFLNVFSTAEVPVTVTLHGEQVERDALAPIGSIASPEQTDLWEIRAAPGATVNLLAVGRAYADVPLLADPSLRVYGSDGELVAFNEDRGANDKQSEVSFTAAGGTYVVAVRGAQGSTGGYRLGTFPSTNNENHVFRPFSGVVFAGAVTRREDGQPATGRTVSLLRRGSETEPDQLLSTASTDHLGRFSFPGFWSGTLAVEALEADGVAVARRAFDVTPGQDPGPLDLTVPVHGTVSVVVVRGADAVPGVEVTVESDREDLLPADHTRSALTDSAGVATFSMAVGPVTARAADPEQPAEVVTASGEVRETEPLALTLELHSSFVSVSGTVKTLDGTPLPGATVTLLGAPVRETSANLLQNPGNDEPRSGAAIPGWTPFPASATWGVAVPGTQTFPLPFDGTSYFYAGNRSLGEVFQDVDLLPLSLDLARVSFEFQGHVRTAPQTPLDQSRVIVEYRNSSNSAVLGQYDSGLQANSTTWVPLTDLRLAPAGTRFIRVRLIATRISGTSNDGYFDGLSLRWVRDDQPQVGSQETGPDGSYRFEDVPTFKSYTLTASYPNVAPVSEALELGGTPEERHFSLPVPILKGRVLEEDGSAVAGAEVDVCSNATGACWETGPQTTGSDGSFFFLGRPDWTGTSTILVHPPDGTEYAEQGVPFGQATTGTVSRDVILPAGATVHGTVVRPSGAVVAGARVALYELTTWAGWLLDREVTTDEQGAYRFARLLLGEPTQVRVYAESPEGDPGEARATLEPLQSHQLDVTVADGGTLAITLTGGLGSAFEGSVLVEAPLARREDGETWRRRVTIRDDPTLVRVPAGPYRVVYDGECSECPEEYERPGAADGELAADETRPVSVRSGSHVRQPQELEGDQGLYTTDEGCHDAECGPFAQTVVPGLGESYPEYAAVELDGRALRGLQAVGTGLRVRRVQYVPPSGAFTRTLTLVKNVTAEPMTVGLESTLAVQRDYELTAPFETSSAFAIAERDPELLGMVVGDKLPAVLTEHARECGEGEVGPWCNDGHLLAVHALTVPAGSTVAFLTFSIAALDGDLEAFRARAEDLVALTAPDALTGLDDELGLVVNFVLPGDIRVTGRVEDASIAVPDARVGAVRNGRVASQAVADEAGVFALGRLSEGTYTLVAYDPVSMRPGRLPVTLSGELDVEVGPIALVSDAEAGTVRVRFAGGSPANVASLTVEGYGPFWKLTVLLDEDGEAVFTGVPAGAVRVTSPLGDLEGQLAPGGTLELVRAGRPGCASIGGRVVDQNWDPVTGARVAAFFDEVIAAETTSAADGTFLLTNLGESWYDVQAYHAASGRLTWSESVSLDPESCPEEWAGDLMLQDDDGAGTVVVQGYLAGSGLPAAGAAAELRVDNNRFWRATVTLDAQGRAVVTGVPAGTVRVSSTLATVFGYLAPGGTLEIVLAEGTGCGTVMGRVEDGAGGPVPNARVVALLDYAGPVAAETASDAAGRFRISGLEAPWLVVQAHDPLSGRVTWPADVELDAYCQFDVGVLALLSDEELGTVRIEGVLEPSRAPAAGAVVELKAVYAPLWQATVTLDAQGRAEVAGVPSGQVVVTSGTLPDAGWSDGWLEAQATLDVTLRIGQATTFPVDLTGGDGVPYFVHASGVLMAQGTSSCAPFCGPFASVDYWTFWDRGLAVVGQAGREVDNGPRSYQGVQMTRRAFVPEGGRFARLLEVLENGSGQAVTVRLGINQTLGTSGTGGWSVRATSSGDADFTVEDWSAAFSHGGASQPEIAMVLGNAGSSLPHDDLDWFGGSSSPWVGLSAAWSEVTVPAGGTAIVMSFLVQRPHGQTAETDAQVDSLLSLGDEDALAGMSPAERAAVVNFSIPPGLVDP